MSDAPSTLMLPKPPKRSPKPKRPLQRTRRPRKKARGLTLPGLRNKLDELFAVYVRERDGNVCITCGRTAMKEGDWHAGHFIPRGKMSARWDPKNCHSQCGWVCNYRKRGALREYALAIMDRYGAHELQRLLRAKDIEKKFCRADLVELIDAIQRGGAEFESVYYEKHATWV